jgi:hypothetical protein
MSDKSEYYIRNYAANLFVVSVFYIGYSFYETSMFFDVIILMVLSFIVFKWKSRVASLLTISFGCVSLFLLFGTTDWLRFALSFVILWSGGMALYHSNKYHKIRKG